MKIKKTATKLKPGLTLIEITVVILVLLTLIAVLFIGANIYKKGADRAACILNIRNIHQAVRANQNLYNLKPATGTYAGDTLTKSDIVGTADSYIEDEPLCPHDTSAYTFVVNYPQVGTVAVTCTNATSLDHVPASTEGW
jgi:type II secretory pathway pseudopilin PulG